MTFNEVEAIILPKLSDDWRTFKSILWDLNGPLELPFTQDRVKTALRSLVSKRIVESRAGVDDPRAQYVARDDSRLYRLAAIRRELEESERA